MNNYEYCAKFAANLENPDARVLDYGCGAGPIVDLLQKQNIAAWGCEAFYEGGDVREKIPPHLRDRIFAMQGDRIPFDNKSFDLVISNMVLEHVADLNVVLAEIARVLKPGGISLNLFPDRGVWREGHSNVPFLHRFPKGSSLRRYYAAAFYNIGYFTEGKSRMQWATDFCKWLDDWTHYRSLEEIHQSFRTNLSEPQHIEADWMRARKPQTSVVPASLRALAARKFAHTVVIAKKSML